MRQKQQSHKADRRKAEGGLTFLPSAWSLLAVAGYLHLLRNYPRLQLLVPLIHQRPINGASSPISHVQIAIEPLDRSIQQRVVLAKDRAVAGE